VRRILIGLALALVASAAWGQPTQQQLHDWCYSDTAGEDQTIVGCTAVIQSGKETTANQANAYVNRAYAYTHKNLFDQAIADGTQALALSPNDPVAYNNRASAYRGKGLYDQAIADATRAIALKPDYKFAYVDRGLAYAAKGSYDQAIADYTAAIRLDPDYTLAYNDRGDAYAKKGLRDLAVADYRSTLKLDPTQLGPRIGLTQLGAAP
jgi:tetratricopeptide (TPR) repeat protein